MSAPSPRTRPLLLGEVALVAFLFFGYDRVAATANVAPDTAIRHGRQLLAVEQFFHLAIEQPVNSLIAGWRFVDQLLSIYYDFAHGVVTFTVLGLVYVFASEGYRRARTALFVLNGAGMLIFWLLPVAPPRLLTGGGFTDVVANSGTWGAWETGGGSTLAEHANHFASMPSLHVAYAVWVLRTVLVASTSRLWRTLAALHVGVTVAIVVVTGNHYLLDVLAGAALAEASWWLAAVPLRAVTAIRRPAAVTGAARR